MLAIRQTASASDSCKPVVIDDQDENESNQNDYIVNSSPMIIVEESNALIWVKPGPIPGFTLASILNFLNEGEKLVWNFSV